MSSLALTVVILLVLALCAFAGWIYARSRSSRRESEPERRLSAERLDTTLGDLRDVREALRPVAGVVAKKTSPTKSKTGVAANQT
jgi:hypothetical protein